MPYFSFILKNNILSDSITPSIEVPTFLEKNKRYFSKNTKVWRILNTTKYKNQLIDIKIEAHQKIRNDIKKILFCLPPSTGLGDVIEYGLAIKAIEKENLFQKIGIAFPSRVTNILKNLLYNQDVYSDFISETEMNNYEGIFHFSSEIKDLKLQKYQRQNIETVVTNYFNVGKYRSKKNNTKNNITKVSLFPESRSPIRTLPYFLINGIIDYLVRKNISVDLVLDNNSKISKEIKKSTIYNQINIYTPSNLSFLNNYIQNIEFGIHCDSGPFHLSKLYNKRCFLISTSVDAKKLFTESDNITYINSKYVSPYCRAPCGLTNIFNYKGTHGCYDSIKVQSKEVLRNENLNQLNRGNLISSYQYFINNPVGCVRSLKLKTILTILDKTLNNN